MSGFRRSGHIYNTASGYIYIGLGDWPPCTGNKCYILAVTQGFRALPDMYAHVYPLP